MVLGIVGNKKWSPFSYLGVRSPICLQSKSLRLTIFRWRQSSIIIQIEGAIGLVQMTYFHHFFQTIAGVLVKLFEKVKSQIHLKYRKLVTNVNWQRSLHRFSIMQRIYNMLEYHFAEKIREEFCKRYKQYFELAWHKKPCHAFHFLLENRYISRTLLLTSFAVIIMMLCSLLKT